MEFIYSDEAILFEAVRLVKCGFTFEYIADKYNLTDDDLDLIDFIANEF